MNLKIAALAAAGLLVGTSAVALAGTSSVDNALALQTASAQVSAMTDVTSQAKKKKKKKKMDGDMGSGGAMGTGASAPVPAGGAGGSASGTTGTDKKPGPPSAKTR